MYRVVPHEYPRDRPFLRHNNGKIEYCVYSEEKEELEVHEFSQSPDHQIILDRAIYSEYSDKDEWGVNEVDKFLEWDEKSETSRNREDIDLRLFYKDSINNFICDHFDPYNKGPEDGYELEWCDKFEDGQSYSVSCLKLWVDDICMSFESFQCFSYDLESSTLLLMKSLSGGKYELRIMKIKNDSLMLLGKLNVDLNHTEVPSKICSLILDAKEMTIRLTNSPVYWFIEYQEPTLKSMCQKVVVKHNLPTDELPTDCLPQID
jgi:hypothetical protein